MDGTVFSNFWWKIPDSSQHQQCCWSDQVCQKYYMNNLTDGGLWSLHTECEIVKEWPGLSQHWLAVIIYWHTRRQQNLISPGLSGSEECYFCQLGPTATHRTRPVTHLLILLVVVLLLLLLLSLSSLHSAWLALTCCHKYAAGQRELRFIFC